jgi:hypothetical protein
MLQRMDLQVASRNRNLGTEAFVVTGVLGAATLAYTFIPRKSGPQVAVGPAGIRVRVTW